MRRPIAALSLPAPLAGLLAPTFATWAVIAADIGWTQMSARGVICGASAPHCAWCYAAAALGLAAVASLVSAGGKASLCFRIGQRRVQ